MAMDEYDGPSDEAKDIVKGLRKKRGASAEEDAGDEGDSSESGSAGEEAFTSASEDLFRMLKGRDPKESEASELGDIVRRLVQNCGEGDE